jgi:hypothetical protein
MIVKVCFYLFSGMWWVGSLVLVGQMSFVWEAGFVHLAKNAIYGKFWVVLVDRELSVCILKAVTMCTGPNSF